VNGGRNPYYWNVDPEPQIEKLGPAEPESRSPRAA
jgi:hypothetical protein